MLVKIKMNNGTTLDFNKEDLPLGDDLKLFLDFLNSDVIPLCEQYKIAHLYRFYYSECQLILKTIQSNNKGIEEDIVLLNRALNLQHRKEVESSIPKRHVEYIIEGFISFVKKDYTKALSYFTKEKFSFGVDLCDFFFGTPRNKFLKALAHLRNIDTKEVDTSKQILKGIWTGDISSSIVDEEFSEYIKINKKALENILYCLNLIDSCNDESNVDVRQKKVYDLINNGKYKESVAILEKQDFTDKNYLLGKIEHQKGNYKEAKQFYKKCISEGHTNTRNYIFSKYNYERITQENPLPFSFDSQELNDLNVFLKQKNGIELGDLSGCSRDLQDFMTINKGISDGLESFITRYDTLKNNRYMEKFVYINNLIYLRTKNKLRFVKGRLLECDLDVKEYTKMISSVVDDTSPNYKDALLYNKAYLTQDVKQFSGLNLQQAKIMKAFLNKEDVVLKSLGLIELSSCLKEDKDTIELLSSKSSLYSNLQLGKLYLDKYLEYGSNIDLSFAIKYFLKEPRSFYAANGLGVCLALQKKYSEALKVFNSVLISHKPSHVNLGNVYILSGEYEKGILEYLKHKKEGIEDVALRYKDFITVDLMINLYERGLKGLGSMIFEKLIDEDRLDEAKRYKVKDKKLNKLYENKLKENKTKDEEMKRKIEELEKYKRAKNIK